MEVLQCTRKFCTGKLFTGVMHYTGIGKKNCFSFSKEVPCFHWRGL